MALTLSAGIVLATALAAGAHSFNLVMIAPDDAEIRQVMRQAFLIASAERDSHAAQESDGHLGGLDVYLGFAGIGDGEAAAALAPDILAAPLAGTDAAAVTALAASLDVVSLAPADPNSAMSRDMLAQPLDPGLPAFAQAFEAETGQAPGAEAVAVYLAARRVDQAVRQLGGVGDAAGLRALLSR